MSDRITPVLICTFRSRRHSREETSRITGSSAAKGDRGIGSVSKLLYARQRALVNPPCIRKANVKKAVSLAEAVAPPLRSCATQLVNRPRPELACPLRRAPGVTEFHSGCPNLCTDPILGRPHTHRCCRR